MRSSIDKNLRLFAVSFIALTISNLAHAQTAAAQGDDATGQGEIIVTAQKRTESAQNVPITLNVFSGATMRNEGIATTTDLQAKVPGLVYLRNSSNSNPFLRGIGSEVGSTGTESSVAVHLDGVYIARPAATLVDFFDIDRVEVLKGPQGTLYGRNATGGVINMISVRPHLGQTDGYIRAGYGNYDSKTLQGAINIPLGDHIAYRVSGLIHTNDGYNKNVFLNTDADYTKSYNIRNQLAFEPSDSLKIRLFAAWSKTDQGTGVVFEDISYPASYYATPGSLMQDKDPRTLAYDVPETSWLKLQQYGGEIEWDAGAFSVKSLTAYVHSQVRFTSDYDGTNANIFGVFGQGSLSDQWTQEFSLASKTDGPLSWTAGLFYFHEDASTTFYALDAGASFGMIGGSIDMKSPYTFLNYGTVATDSYAGYGQVTWAFTDRFSATAGLRYTDETKHLDVDSYAIQPFPGQPASGLISIAQAAAIFPSRGAKLADGNNARLVYHIFTPRFAVEFKANPDLLIFGSVTNGFKSGGANVRLTNFKVVRPEKVWTYEAGFKSTLLDRRLTLNLSAYYYDFRDMQLNVTSPENIANNNFTRDLLNAGNAQIYGAEAQVNFQVTPKFNVFLNGALQHSEFTSHFVAADATHKNAVSDIKGNTIPRAPDLTLDVGAGYTFAEIPGVGALRLQGDYAYRSDTYYEIFQNAPLMQKAYGLLNAQLTLTSPNRDWTVNAYVRNATDELYRLNKTYFYGTFDMLGAPRTYGIEIERRF